MSEVEPSSALPSISWDEDAADRVNPAILTQLLGDVVPVLRWTGWHLTAIEEGHATSLLPLNDESTNQHGTHQAALLGLSADYTGGAALLSLIRGVPALGVHPQLDNEGCAMWLVGLEMKYLLPSSAPLTASATIAPERWEQIRGLYLRGRTVLDDIEVTFTSDGETIATGRCRYFLKRASRLEPAELHARPNPIYAHRSKASARLIAGVRAAETRGAGRIRDPWAEGLAGPHGAFLARRFSQILPPLQDIVAARTADADAVVRSSLADGCRQLVLVGVGLDMRPYRVVADAEVEVFELDLPHMLEERMRLLAQLELPPRRRTAVPFNLHRTSIARALAATAFRVDQPAVVVIEGVSMYLDAAKMRALVDDLAAVLGHTRSVAWMDVARARVLTPTGVPSIDAFIVGMQKLGEPFTFGVETPERWLDGSPLEVRRAAAATQLMDGYYDLVQIGRRAGYQVPA